jgi:hypothetical protein
VSDGGQRKLLAAGIVGGVAATTVILQRRALDE